MKKKLSMLLILCLSFAITACTPKEKPKQAAEPIKQEVAKETPKKDNDKEETKISGGPLYDKMSKLSNLKSITEIKNTKIGFTNLTIEVNVEKGTAIVELKSFTEQVGKLQAGMKQDFLEKDYKGTSYMFNIDGNLKSVVVTYKQENGDYKLEGTNIMDEEYKKAANYLK